MSLTQYIVTFYILSWAVRIRGWVRRWRQPQLRGQEWFFNVHVQPGFYTGAGRKILHAYWMRIFIPSAIDIPVATAIFISGHLLLLRWLILALAVLIHLNHVFSVDLAERQARSFAVPEAEQPVRSMVLSLKTRRLRDYSNRKLEVALAVSYGVALAWLVWYYFAAPDHQNLRLVFAVPIFLLYVQTGMVLVKQMIVAWRMPVPQAQVDEHIAAHEESRKLYLKVCDFGRISCSVAILVWPVLLGASPAHRELFVTLWLISGLVAGVVATVWQEISRKKVLAVALRARPVKLPDLLGQSDAVLGPVCYQPSTPMLVLKGARGYSLNLGNTFAQLSAVYLAGLVVLMVLLRTAP